MKTDNTIEHLGVVREINDSRIVVGIEPQAACAGCAARKICDSGSDSEKIIEVIPGEAVDIGEQVKVILQQSLGFRALFLGYILPFLLMVGSLIVFQSILHNEGLAGLFALLSLLPYYGILYLSKEKISQQFRFTLKKLTT